MINIPKKPFVDLLYGRTPRAVRVILAVSLAFLFFFYPLRAANNKPGLSPYILLIYAAFLALCYTIHRRESDKDSHLKVELEKFQEKKNYLASEFNNLTAVNTSLYSRVASYGSLRMLAEKLGGSTDVDEVISIIVDSTYRMTGGRGNCLLYLTDIRNQQLELVASRKESAVVIKAKKGDVFDRWVLKHTSALIVEDINNDFRFDIEGMGQEERRGVTSLIAAPFISDSNVVGVLRMDSAAESAFSLDDLRLLKAIADLGAVAIEDAQFYQQTLQLAVRDGLTGLYLRRYLSERLREEVEKAARGKSAFSFLMMDIDHFKEYNDRYGHTAGDIVLRRLSEILLSACSQTQAVVSRFGGEEFAVVLPGSSKDEAVRFAEGLREKISSEEVILRRMPTRVRVSAGVACFPDDAESVEGIIEAADRALYRAKEQGRDRVCSA